MQRNARLPGSVCPSLHFRADTHPGLQCGIIDEDEVRRIEIELGYRTKRAGALQDVGAILLQCVADLFDRPPLPAQRNS